MKKSKDEFVNVVNVSINNRFISIIVNEPIFSMGFVPMITKKLDYKVNPSLSERIIEFDELNDIQLIKSLENAE